MRRNAPSRAGDEYGAENVHASTFSILAKSSEDGDPIPWGGLNKTTSHNSVDGGVIRTGPCLSLTIALCVALDVVERRNGAPVSSRDRDRDEAGCPQRKDNNA